MRGTPGRVAVGLVGLALAAVPAARAGGLQAVGQLSVPDSPSSFLTGDMDASGPVLGVLGGDGNAYVFLEPAGGWTSESPAAELVGPGGGDLPLQEISVSPTAIFAQASRNDDTASADEVYVPPAGGWRGQITPSAQLLDSEDASAPGAAWLGSPTVSGDAVFAEADDASPAFPAPPPPDRIDVFLKPAGGWSGDVTESARLEDSDGRSLDPIAFLGSAVFAEAWNSDNTRLDVFAEPPGGWSGTVSQAATLQIDARPAGSAPAGVPVTVIGDEVFAEPADGWHGAVAPVAQLLALHGEEVGTDAAFDGRIVMSGCEHIGTPDQGCELHDWLFDPVDGRWSGSIAAAPILEGGHAASYATPPAPLLADADTLFNDPGYLGQITIDHLTGHFGHRFRPSPPRVSLASQSGLTGRRPALLLHIQPAQYAADVRTVVLRLPAGLSFRGSGVIDVEGNQRLHATLDHGRLHVWFGGSARVTLALNAGSIAESPGLAARLRRPGARPFVGVLRVSVHDTSGRVTQHRLTLRVKR